LKEARKTQQLDLFAQQLKALFQFHFASTLAKIYQEEVIRPYLFSWIAYKAYQESQKWKKKKKLKRVP
jgi:hypothetical protein